MPLIDEGARAPMFALKDQNNEKHALKDALARGPVVVYFYPKDDTSGCTKQACGFRDALPGFEKLGVTVLGISPQDEASKAKFAAKHDLNFPILADHDAKVCEKYGVWQERSMYGNKFMGVVRTTYIVAPSGKVARRFDKVKVPGHAEAVMASLEEAGLV